MAAAVVESDVAVVGAGLAGLTAALEAARLGARVALVVAGGLGGSNSAAAQGGIAAAVGSGDAPELHAADSMRAGRGLAVSEAVRVLTEEAPARLADLVALGVPFDRGPEGSLDLGLEGGHERRRVAHADGLATGAAVVATLGRHLSASPVRLLEGWRALRLITDGEHCQGVVLGRGREVALLRAGAIILATGGFGALYARSTNPPGARGQGIALAYLAGAEVADLEFVQFHPTALALGDGPALLLSEALRGEGAVLLDRSGQRFLPRHDPLGELAPRDVVAKAIWREMAASGAGCVHLSLEAVPRDTLARSRALLGALRDRGIDPVREPVPVAPAAHYTIGGVLTDAEGRTSLPGLLACGEVACTGVHGANRLASNSLLECLVFGRRAAHAACAGPPDGRPGRSAALAPPAGSSLDWSDTMAAADPPELGRLLWEHAGLVRTADGLRRLQGELAARPPSPGVVVARLLAGAALLREESRGAQWRDDFPDADPRWGRHIVWRRGGGPRAETWEPPSAPSAPGAPSAPRRARRRPATGDAGRAEAFLEPL